MPGFKLADHIKPKGNGNEKKEMQFEKVSLKDIIVNEDNFYSIDEEEVKALKCSIELLGVKQPPIVKKCEAGYKLIAGEKRYRALQMLVEEGKSQYEEVKVFIDNTGDEILEQIALIQTNSTQRKRTDYELMEEVKRLEPLIEKLKKENRIDGRLQTLIAEVLNTSKTKIGTLKNIDKNLSDNFKEELKQQNISTSTANKIAGVSKEKQDELFEQYKENGKITAEEVEKKITETDFEVEHVQLNPPCYDGCKFYNTCDKKNERVEKCEMYEKNLTEEEKRQIEYDNEQKKIDADTKKALQKMKEEQKQEKAERVYEVIAAEMNYRDMMQQKRPFEIVKGEYKKGEKIKFIFKKDGKNTGNELNVRVTYVQCDTEGVMEGYSVISYVIEQKEEQIKGQLSFEYE